MSAVDYSWYTGTYYGSEADEASFPALNARAEDVIGSLTRWQVTDDTLAGYPELTQTLYKKAICAQIDYFAVNGVSFVTASDGTGFTVGKVSVHNSLSSKGASSMAAKIICPLALQFLEQSGLMGPQVPTAPDIPYWGGWMC